VDGKVLTRINKTQVSEISVFRSEFILIRILDQIHLFKFSEVTSPLEGDIDSLASTLSTMASEEEQVIEISRLMSRNSDVLMQKLTEIQKTFEKGKIVKLVLTEQSPES
jgi:hypothetical protein